MLSPDTKEIGTWAFDGCSSLKSIDLPYGLQAVKDFAFDSCSSLERIDIPDTVTLIGSSEEPDSWENGSTFAACKSLKEVNLPSGLIEIQGRLFEGCCSLESIDFPEHLQAIKAYAFSGCHLKEVDLPESVCLVATCAFSKNPQLERVSIHYHGNFNENSFLGSNWLTGCNVGIKAFYKCPALKSVTLDIPILYLNRSTFEGCTSLTTVFLPATLKEIEQRAFYNCESLKKVKLPATVERIGKNAFYNSGLNEITLPKNLTKVDQEAFANCGNLKKIVFKGKNTKIAVHAFTGIYKKAVFDVPDSSIQAYRKRLTGKDTGYVSRSMKIQ